LTVPRAPPQTFSRSSSQDPPLDISLRLGQSSEGVAGGERKRNARYADSGESETATLRLPRGPAEGSMPVIHSEATTRIPGNCSATGIPSSRDRRATRDG